MTILHAWVTWMRWLTTLGKKKKKVEDKLPILVQWSMVVIYVIYQQQCQVGFIPHHSSSKFRFMIMGMIED